MLEFLHESSWATATPFGQYGTVHHPLDVNDLEKKMTAFNLSNPPRESEWNSVYMLKSGGKKKGGIKMVRKMRCG